MTYHRAYRIFGFGSLGFVVLVFSVALSRALGVIGLILPSLLIGIVYLFITTVLDVVIDLLEIRHADPPFRRKRKPRS